MGEILERREGVSRNEMISLDKITIEYKSTVLFGFTALFLSFIIGFLAGVRWNVVVLRSVLLMAVFSVIGYGICVILKKFVPEVYGILTSHPAHMTEGAPGGEPDIDMQDGAQAEYAGEEGGVETAPPMESTEPPRGDEFRELEKDGLTHYSTDAGGGSGVHTPTGKLGKHILEKEKLAKYEPKIMAQAVRTMMGKDRE